jgi:hypothetical protein
MSHKNFLMWLFSTIDPGKTREFHGVCWALTVAAAPQAMLSRPGERLERA